MKKWLTLIGSLLIFGNVEADIRVLFRFDASGHFVHRIYQISGQQKQATAKISPTKNSNQATNSVRPFPASPIDRGRSWQNALVPEIRRKQQGTVDGFARLVWFDLSGNDLAQTEVPDPRIVHSPSHTLGVNASRNGLTDGAWLASGPESAVRVTVLLPESMILGLATEFWILELTH
ncbi:MAG: hypothetical protein ACI9UN_002969 [Granulosicoccus sp.]|jgi:hypothetical protein